MLLNLPKMAYFFIYFQNKESDSIFLCRKNKKHLCHTIFWYYLIIFGIANQSTLVITWPTIEITI